MALPLTHLCILDFEATCDNNHQWHNEIIEFPVVVLALGGEGEAGEVVGEFGMFVRPRIHPVLTKFCTDLTGITQQMVDEEGRDIREVLLAFEQFLVDHVGLSKGSPPSFLFATCGDWDLQTMLTRQLTDLGIHQFPFYLRNWINVKKAYCTHVSKNLHGGMGGMLKHLNLELLGRHHRGIDDCRNITRIVQKMMTDYRYTPVATSSTRWKVTNSLLSDLLSSSPAPSSSSSSSVDEEMERVIPGMPPLGGSGKRKNRNPSSSSSSSPSSSSSSSPSSSSSSSSSVSDEKKQEVSPHGGSENRKNKKPYTPSSSSSSSSPSSSSSSSSSPPSPPSYTIVDIGANLTHPSFKDVGATIAKAHTAGLGGIILTGTSLSSTRDALSLCDKHPSSPLSLTLTSGVHPHDAKHWNADVSKEIQAILRDDRVVAVGECGLDYDRDFSPRPLQIACFEEQIQISLKVRKPLFLHERSAFSELFGILKKYHCDHLRGVVHCFTGTTEEVKAYVSLGMYVGITGWVCDERRNGPLLEALPHIPLNRLLIETDCPFLTPRNMKPRCHTNEPRFLPFVLKKIAEVLNVSEKELADVTTQNAIDLFGPTVVYLPKE